MSRRIAARVGAIALITCLMPSCATAPARRPRQPTVDPRVALPTSAWPRREVLDLAMQAYRCGRRAGYFQRPVLTVIDYSLPSSERRLWVIDIRRKRILHNELVAHGVNSGDQTPVAFSNQIGSRQTSLGLFRTDETYFGKHGYSLRLSGLEVGVNDNARERALVIHGAEYVSDAVVSVHGRLGRSWGCPALPAAVSADVIDQIQGGSAVFAYYPDANWLRASPFLHCDGRVAQQ